MSDAIVLSGGGARGDFELGALRYLYDIGVSPDILCGTSVGSINAIKLAEGEDPSNPWQGLAGLEEIWSGLKENSDMYLEEDWLHHPDMDPRIANLLTGKSSDMGINAPDKSHSEWGDLAPIIAGAEKLFFLLGDGAQILKSLGVFTTKARGLYNLNPLWDKVQRFIDPNKVQSWAASGGKLRVAIVGLESGRLRYVTETSEVIERDSGIVPSDAPAPACMNIAAAVSDISSEIDSLKAEKQSAQSELSSAATGEKSQLVAYIRNLNDQISDKSKELEVQKKDLEECMRINPAPLRLSDIRTGVLASAAIPGIFLPMKIGNEYYVDGGVREILPLQAAVDLGASTIYAVSASAPVLAPFKTPTSGGLMDIVSRSLLGAMLDEVGKDDKLIHLHPGQATPQKIYFIEPDTNDIHDITVIDPGLIQICRDYGYMRAADVVNDVVKGSERFILATEIALHRKDIWSLENRRHGQADPTTPWVTAPAPDPSLDDVISTKKQELRQKLERRRQLQGPMPAGIDVWVNRNELHRWDTVRDAAAFISQNVPTEIATGTTVQVSVIMRNNGTTVWDPSAGYKLGSQSPQDNFLWGTNRVLLPHPVPPGEQVVFNFSISSAPGQNNAIFQWKMLKESVQWFGQLTEPMKIVSKSQSEPAECTTYRNEIRDLESEIIATQQEIDSENPRHSGGIHTRISNLNRRLNHVRERARQLGCTV